MQRSKLLSKTFEHCIVKEKQKGKNIYTQQGLMKVVQDELLQINLDEVNCIIVYALDVCDVLAYSSNKTKHISGNTCFQFYEIQTINEHLTYRIDCYNQERTVSVILLSCFMHQLFLQM